MESLGRPYAYMVLSALTAITIDQTLIRTVTSTGRIALDGVIGAAIGLGVLKLVALVRRVQ